MLTEPDRDPPRRLRADRKGEDAWDLQIGSAEASKDSEDHQKVAHQKSRPAMSVSGNKAHASGEATVGKPTAPFDGGGRHGHPDTEEHDGHRRNSRKRKALTIMLPGEDVCLLRNSHRSLF